MLSLLIILVPFLGSLIVFFQKNRVFARNTALIISIIELLLVSSLFYFFDKNATQNFSFNYEWIKSAGINISLSIDGIGLILVALTAIITPLIIYSSFLHEHRNSNIFYGFILQMQAALIGLFVSYDALLFYVFWEMALIPIYFLNSIWGGNDRIRITFKFFVYTMFGSLFMLIGIIYLYSRTPEPHSFNFTHFYNVDLTLKEQIYLFLAFFLAFAVKIPIFPFHSWQPSTYVNAPTAGTMLMSALMLKMGLFGIFRFIIPFMPKVVDNIAIYAIILSVIGLIYGAMIAIKQTDLKRFTAFSSLSHVGLIAAAMFTFSSNGLNGGVLQMFAHGINVFAMFYIVELIEKKYKTRNINELNGLVHYSPKLSIFFMIVLLSNIALPLTAGFPGEFLMLSAIFTFNPYIGAIAGISVILGAVYMLTMFQKVIFGKKINELRNHEDLNNTEFFVSIIIMLIIIVLGVYPSLITNFSTPIIDKLIF